MLTISLFGAVGEGCCFVLGTLELFFLFVHREVSAFKFIGQGSVHRKIPFDIFPTRCNITQFIYFWKTALHVSGGVFAHHQEHTQLYLQYLVLVKPLLLPAGIAAGSSWKCIKKKVSVFAVACKFYLFIVVIENFVMFTHVYKI